MRVARNAIRHVASIFDEDTIYGFKTLEDTQTAKPVMQRFIMAMPQLREMYHEQRVDGYSSSYVDLQPGVVGEDHYDYRRVTDGVMMESEDGDDLVWTTHFEDLLENDRALDISEQADILNTWDLVSGLIAQRHDPTDVYGGRL